MGDGRAGWSHPCMWSSDSAASHLCELGARDSDVASDLKEEVRAMESPGSMEGIHGENPPKVF